MYTYGKNLFFSEDRGKVSYHGFSISRWKSNYDDSKFFPKEIESEDGFVMLQADFPGVYDMYIPVKKELVQALLNPDTANHRTKDEWDPSSGYFSVIGKLYDDAPVDYRYSTRLRYYGLGLTNYETLGYYLTKMYFNGVNKFLRANLADYEYFTSVIHTNKEDCPFLFTPMDDDMDEEPYYVSVQKEEELNKLLSMTDEVYNNDFIANALYFEEGQSPKYIYVLSDSSFRYSEQLVIDKKYRAIYVYLPTYHMYQMLTIKDIKKLNKITSCKLEYAVVDDPHCFSKIGTSNEYYASNLVDIVEMANSVAIDMYLKKEYYRSSEEMKGDRYNPYIPITAAKRFDAFKISIEFFYHNVELVLTEADFMNQYSSNDRRELNKDNTYSRVENNSFKAASGIFYEYGFWLLSLIIRVAKISLDNIKF